jgi:hypothetical protein
MPLDATSQNYMLNEWGTNEATYASLHTAYSSSGANEVTGGSYGRVAITWSSASGGTLNLASTPYTFNVPSSTTVEYLGFWTASSGGTFLGMTPLGGASAYAWSAPSSTNTLLAPGSSYSANQTVVVFANGGATLPSGLTAGTIYYVISPSGDSFQLSATSGGSAVSLSSDGAGIITAISAETFASSGTYTLNSASWSLT